MALEGCLETKSLILGMFLCPSRADVMRATDLSVVNIIIQKRRADSWRLRAGQMPRVLFSFGLLHIVLSSYVTGSLYYLPFRTQFSYHFLQKALPNAG